MLDMTKFDDPNELPLDNLVNDGGYDAIFRTLGCIGDSLSSGEHESTLPDGKAGYHDFYEYSWGQYLARMAGLKAYNFSRGGMSAKWYDRFADENGFWDEDKLCQGYIIALGVNDLKSIEVGTVNDVNLEDYEKNADTFAGHYGKIIQKIKKVQPKARIFLVTIPRDPKCPINEKRDAHAKLLHDFAEMFEFTYVIDLRKYAPVYDEDFRKKFFLSGHMNAAGYLFTAKMIASYMDYIIRHNMEDFSQVGFIGTGYHSDKARW